MTQHELVCQRPKLFGPPEEAGRLLWRLLILIEDAEEGPGSIDAVVLPLEEQEDQKDNGRDDDDG